MIPQTVQMTLISLNLVLPVFANGIVDVQVVAMHALFPPFDSWTDIDKPSSQASSFLLSLLFEGV